MTYQTHSPEETRALGAQLAEQLQPGDVILLLGDMGAGKSELTRGIARGLGIEDPITSPTYTIVNEYPGKIPLFHFDMYRLGSSEDLFDIGWEDYLTRGGVIAVEWSERVEDALDEVEKLIRIHIRRDPEHDNGRTITIEGGVSDADLSL